jgi:hypothetical protein
MARENLSSSSTCSRQDLDYPFAQGSFRWAAQGVYTNGPRCNQPCVWKWFKQGSVFAADYFRFDIKAVEKAIQVVGDFNAARVIDAPITINRATVWTEESSGEKYLVEPFIKHWRKFNSNSGWRAEEEDDWDQIMQTLSHFSYHSSGGFLVLCDLQGGLARKGCVLSDPVIMSRSRMYGVTDLGVDGIINFFHNHECNQYCGSHWAVPKFTRAYYEPQQGTTMELLPKHAPTRYDRDEGTAIGDLYG